MKKGFNLFVIFGLLLTSFTLFATEKEGAGEEKTRPDCSKISNTGKDIDERDETKAREEIKKGGTTGK